MCDSWRHMRDILPTVNRAMTLQKDIDEHRMFLVIIGFLTSIVSGSANSRAIDKTLTRFVIDAMASDHLFFPTTLTAFLCTGEDETVDFSRRLSRSHSMHVVHRSIEELDVMIPAHNRHQHSYVLDLDCPFGIEALLKANASRLFVAPNKWLILQDFRVKSQSHRDLEYVDSRTNDTGRVNGIFDDLAVFPDSEIMLAQRLDKDFIKLLSVYRPSPFRGVIREDRGYWRSEKGIHLRTLDVSSRRRRNLYQTPLKSCLVITNPDSINHLTDYRDKHIDVTTKANYPWILHLVNMMNASVSFAINDTWGYRSENGSWNGMIGMLVRGEIDIGGTAIFITSDRIGLVQYISLYTPTRAKFVFRQPSLSHVSNLFTLPFRNSVWLSCGIFLILVSGILYLTLKWEWINTPSEDLINPHWSGNLIRPSWSDNLLIVIGAISQQGSSYEPRAIPPRIVMLMLFVAVLSLYASYTANIVVILQSTTDSIKTIKDLLQSPLTLGVEDTVYNRYYFQTYQDPVRKAVYEQKIEPKGRKSMWMSMEEGIRRLRNELFAFHFELGAGYKLVQETFQEDEKCGFQEINYMNQLYPLLIIQYQSPYTEIIKVGALKIHESGLRTREITRLFAKKPVCYGYLTFVSVSLIESYAAFMTLGYGILISLVILFLEVLWQKKCISLQITVDCPFKLAKRC